MQLMDCLANLGPLQPDFKCVKPCLEKTVDLEDVFGPFGGLIGAPGVTAVGDGPLRGR